MAKKSQARSKASRGQQQRRQAKPGQQRRQGKQGRPHRWQQMLLGGVILLLVIGIAAFIRYRQQTQILPRLQGALENHYTRGVAGAPVVIKEFSDYG